DTGGRISAGEARRLACTAGIIPVVLGGKSQVLDVGRKRRLHTESMRIAMAVRDRGCTADGCETPPGMCHAHHDQPWSKGGSTSVRNGRLLCPRHHARAHDPTHEMAKLPGGKIRFHRRT
ncbi:MAG: HNH endonuclease signature motif containing protein, partial [Nocardioides sp.]